MTNRPGDRVAALRLWRRALAVLPATSPYRPAFLDRLARGLIEAFEADSRREALLDAGVEAARAAWTGGTASPSASVFATHLADGLTHRWELRGQRRDLEEAVAAGRQALAGMAPKAPRRRDVAANLAALLVDRYVAYGTLADLDDVIGLLGMRPDPGQDGTRTRALIMRYERSGARADLDAAISAGRQAAVRAAGTSRGASVLGHLARALYRRYEVTGRLSWLTEVIGHSRAALAATGARAASRPDRLGQLAILLQIRYERTGDPRDAWGAIDQLRRAEVNDPRAAEVHLRSNLGATLHTRFAAGGRFDEIDEAVRLHERAVAAADRHAPTRPILLNNLGAVLQDRYVYRGDAEDLTAAVRVHEEAVGTCRRAPLTGRDCCRR